MSEFKAPNVITPTSQEIVEDDTRRLQEQTQKVGQAAVGSEANVHTHHAELGTFAGSEVAPLPEGWTYLLHGTHADNWPAGQPSVTVGDKSGGLSGLYATSVYQYELERSRGHDILAEFTKGDEPIELRIIFPSEAARQRRDVRAEIGLSDSQTRLLRRTYDQPGYSHLPDKQVLAKVGEGEGYDGRTAHYYVPESLAGVYAENIQRQSVEHARNYFAQEFGVHIDQQGELTMEPSAEQLAELRDWHERTQQDGLDMPTIELFAAKVMLARALMPQVNESGQVQYLFGKGVGLELALQGNVTGRPKRLSATPYRTHADFEIYAAQDDHYDAIEHSDRFVSVFGAQEIYPVGNTKGLTALPPDLLHATAETVDFGGITFLVPSLEVQLVDKFEKANLAKERELRGKADAELLATTYELDRDRAHEILNDYVITPEISKLLPPEEIARQNGDVLQLKIEQAKRRLLLHHVSANDAEVNAAIVSDPMVMNAAENRGVTDLASIFNSTSGELRSTAIGVLTQVESARQASLKQTLGAKHEALDALMLAS